MRTGNSGNIVLALIIGLLVTLLVLGGGLYYMMVTPAAEGGSTVVVDIPPGMTLAQAARLMENRNLIRSAWSLRLLALLQEKRNKVRIGEYALSPVMPPADILLKITSGQTVLHPITIPEGLRATEIAEYFARTGLVRKEAFLAHTRNKNLAKNLDIPSDSLEGYLFPDTYNFSKYTSAETMVAAMLETFRKTVYLADHLRRAEDLGMSFHQIVTLASLIEKETGRTEERPLISSVFHNRLRKKMLLQTDPTVIYALPFFDGNLRKNDLSYDSPYNTYKYPGLPPGPIASPGRESIRAALYPANTDYLFFVSRQDGSHQFSADLEAHNRAVVRYQLRRS